MVKPLPAMLPAPDAAPSLRKRSGNRKRRLGEHWEKRSVSSSSAPASFRSAVEALGEPD
jgi:hypothetical protein